MKSMILAATALLAMPAIAQTPPVPGGNGPMAPMPAPPPTDGTMPQGGGMQPGGSMPPGQPGMTMGSPGMQMGPMVSNPAPAASASYPVCSKTVMDGCRERNSKK